MAISGMTTGGQSFPFDQFLQAQKRGMRYRPLGGILEGLVVSSPATLNVAGSSIAVSVTAGKAKADAQDVALADNSTATVGLSDLQLVNGLNVVPVYLTPSRKVSTQTTVPGSGDGADYDRRLVVVDAPDGQEVIKIVEKLNGEWVEINPWHGGIAPGNPMSSYTTPPVESGSGNLSLPFNDIIPGLVANTNFTARPEKPVYYPTQVPIQFSQPQKAILRQSASFLIAQLTLDILSLPIQVYATAVGSTLVGDFSPLLKAGAVATTAATRFRVNGLGLTDEGITVISGDGQTITVGSATPTGSGWVTVVPHSDFSPVAYYLSSLSNANSVRTYQGETALLV
jgi:hypothetical protein